MKNNYPRWILILTVMTVAILEVLDSTIVNVSLPTMMPALGADQEQITWILTSYVVASAILLPLTGFLSQRLGQKKLLLINIAGFMASSFLCGIAQSLSMMVLFRLFQGAFGAALIPLSQAIMRQNYKLEEQGKAMAIWGIGLMSAPALGPLLGAFITQNWSWRWIFYINVPICFSALTLTWFFIQDSPISKGKLDRVGLIFMIIGVGALQLFLDQGNTKDWFSSNFILFLFLCAAIFISLFLFRCLTYRPSLIKLSIFKDRNFSICSFLFALYCGSLFSVLIFEPIILETLFNYPILQAGLTTSVCGMASAIGMAFSAPLIRLLNVKVILILGLVFSALGTWKLSAMPLAAEQMNFIIANAILGLGLGFFMVPLTLYSLATLAPGDVTEGAGLFSYSRMLGTSIGIALLTTLLTRETQRAWYSLVGHISAPNPNLQYWLGKSHFSLQNPKTLGILATTLQQQASLLSFNYIAQTVMFLFLFMIPMVLLLKTVAIKPNLPGAH